MLQQSARPFSLLVSTCVLLVACSRSPAPGGQTLTIAAASNLTGVMDELARVFEKQTKVHIVVSYGSTAQLAQQIEHGGPFDVFAAADTEHVDALIAKGKLQPASRAIYARGQLALWIPEGNKRVQKVEDLILPEIRFIALAQPDLAPYGKAAVETLQAEGIWEKVQPKITYANSISMAKQYAASGNANAAFTALSLVMKDRGTVIKVNPDLYQPLKQSVAITTSSAQKEAARQFTAFLLDPRGQAILRNAGYLIP